MFSVNEAECKAAGLDVKKVASIARRIEKAVREADEMGMCLFGGSGSGSLRFDDGKDRKLVVATMGSYGYDGGDGACSEDDDGLMRGE